MVKQILYYIKDCIVGGSFHVLPLLPSMALSVIRMNQGFVQPSETTPSLILDLSIIDQLPVLRCNARTLHVFRHGPGAGQVIREALSRALVPYYPLAGRLKESAHGELQIECCGEGVWYVEASAACMLDSVHYFDDTQSIPYDKLLPDQFLEGINPLVLMQVTQFACGGFVMGLIFCHSICDGLGAAQFLTAVGEMARGLENPGITPVWCRDFSPPQLRQSNAAVFPNLPPPPPPMPDYHLQHANIDISQDTINHLKQDFQNSTGQTCSAFEIIVATVWRRRTQAINLTDNNTQVKLVFFANCRQFLQPPPPQGFYGNCFFPVTITAPSQTVARSSNSELVKLIKQQKSKLPEEFLKWVKGERHENGADDPFAPPLIYTTLFVSEWGRLGFNQIDYGWGPPVHVVPIQGSAIIPVCIVGLLPWPKKGTRLMTWCVEEAHRQPFLDLMAA